ncbi:MAG: ATP-grasp domain-containing protein [Trueperaceae bacterium]
MNLHFLFPSDPLNPKRPDEMFSEQLEILKAKGFSTSLSMTTPDLVVECANKFSSRFFSANVTQRDDGVKRIVELGDGQVSGLIGFSNTVGFSSSMGWSADRFAEVWELALKGKT